MWGDGPQPHHHLVVASEERQLVLWIEPGAPPVGRVGTRSRPPLAFAGWLELLARLAELLDDAPPPTVPTTEELPR